MVAVPTSVVTAAEGPAKNSTFETNAGLTAEVAARSDTGAPTATMEPEAGAVMETDGDVTRTFTAGDVAIAPFESVTRALKAKVPDTTGTQLADSDALSDVETTVVPTRNSSFATVPAGAVAVAEITVEVPSTILVPEVGAVTVAVGTLALGDAATFTLIADEVTAVPLESVTRAVKATVPAAAGVQLAL